MALQHLRSSTADKRPTPAAMSDGQLALNTNLVSPGLFFKDSNGDSVKIGPVHVGTTAPNVTPGAGGQAGNSKGEAWLDTTATNPILKVWNGSAFVAVQPVGTGTVVSTTDTGTVTSTMILDGTILNADINASAAIVDTKLATIATAGKVSNSATTATNANTASAIVARDASGNFSAGTITAALAGNASTVTTNANLTGDVTSVGNDTSIAAGVIVNADVDASAAIAGTKISPNFGSQTIETTGVFSHALGAAATPSLTFTGDLNTGIFSPSADTLAFSEGGVERARINSAGKVLVGNAATNRFVSLFTNDSLSSDAGIEIFRAVPNSNPLNAGLVITVNPANNHGQSGLVLAKTNGNANGSFTAVLPGTLGSVVFAGADGSSLRPAAQITGVGGTPDSGISPGSLPGELAFSTTDVGGTAPTERMRITSAGNVGIGTTSPATTLEVNGNITISDKIIHAGDTDTAIRFAAANTVTVETNALERLRVHSDGNVSIGSATNTGDELYVNGTIRSNGQIKTLIGDTDAAPGYTWQGDEDTGMFRTGVNSLGFTAAGFEIARFNLGGTSGRRQLYFESTAEVWANGSLFLEGVNSVRSATIKDTTTASAGNVFINSSSGILQRSTSSVKYKTDVEDAELSYSEALVYGSRPVWYRSLSENDPSDYSYWGFIAEEVAEIDPRMVHWGDDGPEGVQYDRYVVHLVSVIQKQQQRLDALEARLTAAGI
jgi:hypothetical protein